MWNRSLCLKNAKEGWDFSGSAFLSYFFLKVYHFWVVDADGRHGSENATVVTSLSAHTAIHYKKEVEHQLSHVLVLRPELNCLRQGEDALTEALLDHYLVPPPQAGFLEEIVKEEGGGGTRGGSDRGVLQDQFLDEFVFKGVVKDGFFVEAGADDFLLNSNSLRFELLHNWTGLLVEPLASQFQQG